MMDDPNITMEEYIKLQAEKAQRHGWTYNWETVTYGKSYYDDLEFFTDFEADYPAIVYNDALTSNENIPSKPPRHLWLRCEVERYTKEIVQDYEQRLNMIFGRQVNRVHILDFEGLTVEMRQALTDRLRMEYTRAGGQVLFTSHVWRRLFEIQGPLVCGARRSMTWRQFILALGLHTAEEIAGDGFEARISLDGDFLRVFPSYTSVRDPLRILCHRLIVVSIYGRGQAPKKVTATDLFYLRSMDEGTTVNVPYLLAQYLFRHAKGGKRGAKLSGGYFVGRLVEHFGLVTEEGLKGLTVVVGELRVIDMDELVRLRICERLGYIWAWVAMGPKRQPIDVAGAPEVTEGAPVVNEGVLVIPAPVQRHTMHRTDDASTSAPQQPDP
ncbi:hypothetical protein Tco_0639319 [Tanacetum coccineum]